jgi:hypothetical protein
MGNHNAISDEAFIKAWGKGHGSPSKVAKIMGLPQATIYRKRRSLAEKGIVLKTTPLTNNSYKHGWVSPSQPYPLEISLSIGTGKILCVSDAHYWPGMISTAHMAAVEYAKQEQPDIIAAMGDMFDGATVSRHPPLGWEKLPRVIDELDACRERISEFERAAPKAQRIWHLGNHDARFDRCLVSNSNQYEGIEGFSIKDYFKTWQFTYMSKVNNTLGLRHRPVTGGVHSAYNSAMKYGMSYAHGHLHQLKVTPVDNAYGRIWGVDCGHLADPQGPQFAYREGLTIGACSGFAVLSFYEGRMVDAEICHVNEIGAFFRGEMVVEHKKDATPQG